MGQPQNKPDPATSRAIFNEVIDIETTPIADVLSGHAAAAAVIPRTSPSRLTKPDVAPTPFPTRPVRSRSTRDVPASDTVLYLAYGSNLCAKTFQGQRGIRPLSRVNVSAPALRLTFDLPGLPFMEPCFANTAPRAIPKPPPGMPDLPMPDLPPFPADKIGADAEEGSGFERNERGDPVWTKGLIGVVYEVTREDYARIVATEGGGASYHDIQVPCLPLPLPSVSPPPPFPELPKPFLAHTLCAPRLPRPDDGDEEDDGEDNTSDGGGTAPPELPSRLPGWLKRLFLPVQRPEPDYAQASLRYLELVRSGARENDLPAEYRAYLDALRPYRATTLRQRVGLGVFAAAWAPLFMTLFGISRLFADDRGRIPVWYGMIMSAQFNLVWLSYDWVFKPIFGDGERTIEGADGTSRRGPWWRRTAEAGPAGDEEKSALMEPVI